MQKWAGHDRGVQNVLLVTLSLWRFRLAVLACLSQTLQCPRTLVLQTPCTHQRCLTCKNLLRPMQHSASPANPIVACSRLYVSFPAASVHRSSRQQHCGGSNSLRHTRCCWLISRGCHECKPVPLTGSRCFQHEMLKRASLSRRACTEC